jgi:hypothetical protein
MNAEIIYKFLVAILILIVLFLKYEFSGLKKEEIEKSSLE